jgi:pyrrolidone-carboxylate peptidase
MADGRFVFGADTNIQAALEADLRVVEALRRLGLKCVDARQEMCVAAAVETLADAAAYHDIPLERILDELNRLGVPAKPAP